MEMKAGHTQGLHDEKAEHELEYWRNVKTREGVLSNRHYEYFYTTHFGIDKEWYKNKKILDIGCGPRGSLEWANVAAERVGLDPLAERYVELRVGNHGMRYVTAHSEEIPFSDQYFDVVCSFNSLDHVDDLDQTIREIIRVINHEGLFLLLTDVDHRPTMTEPIAYSWDIVDKFSPHLRILDTKHYEKTSSGIYQSIRAAIPYDHSNSAQRYGILSANLIKPGS